MAKTTTPARTAHPAAPVPTRTAAPAAVPTPTPARRVVLKVRAIRVGYYDHVRRREGDVFVIKDPKEFSTIWMEPVKPNVPEQVTSAPEALKKHHDEVQMERYGLGGTHGTGDPEGATGDLNPLLAPE
jgi:hypothetical protein